MFFHIFVSFLDHTLCSTYKATLCSATSVDVEEHLYRLATNMGITVITSSQVSRIIHHIHTLLISSWQFPCCSPSRFMSFLPICEIIQMIESLCLIICLQRPALIPFHSLELKLIDGEGKWELCSIHQ